LHLVVNILEVLGRKPASTEFTLAGGVGSNKRTAGFGKGNVAGRQQYLNLLVAASFEKGLLGDADPFCDHRAIRTRFYMLPVMLDGRERTS